MLCSFAINQKAGTQEHDEIMFHFRTYLSTVVCNSFGETGWEKQEQTEDPIFAEGEAFDIFIVIKIGYYDVRNLKKQNKLINNLIK